MNTPLDTSSSIIVETEALVLRRFTVGGFQVNTYLLTDRASGESAIVDTGETAELRDALSALLAAEPSLSIVKILLTHGHIDHAGALPLLQARWDVPTYLPKDERPLFDTLPMQGRMFGMPELDRPCGRIDHAIEDGAEIELGALKIGFLSTPGHTPGQGCYFTEGEILVGDTLFAGSIGRTDFPMSDPALMVESLRRLLALPGHLRVHSGHGPVTTLAQELETNPFLGYLRRERGLPEGHAIRWT